MNDELDVLRHCKGTTENITIMATGVSNDTIANDMKFHEFSLSDSNPTASFAEATAIHGILETAINDLFPNILTTIATGFAKNVQNVKKCISVPINCSKSTMKTTTKALIPLLITMNFTTTILPEITNQLNSVDFGSTTLSPDFDIFSSPSSTFFYETSSTNFDNDTIFEDENSTYSMSSTTISTKADVYEATTPKPDFDDIDDDDYHYGGKFASILNAHKYTNQTKPNGTEK